MVNRNSNGNSTGHEELHQRLELVAGREELHQRLELVAPPLNNISDWNP